MIKRAFRFATLMTALSVPMWIGLQEPATGQARAAVAANTALTSAQSVQAAADVALTTQSFWHLMALSSR